MKKLFFIIGLVGLTPIFAQQVQQNDIQITPKNSWFKAGLTLGVPVGDAGDIATLTAGIDLRAQYLFNPNFAIGGASGYTHFVGKDNVEDFGLIPLAGFFRYYFAPKGLFVGTDLGFGLLTNVDGNEGGLYVNPQIGYHNRDWNLYGFYQNTFTKNDITKNDTNLQNVGVGVTYNIRFK